jgi:hypothetical protein
MDAAKSKQDPLAFVLLHITTIGYNFVKIDFQLRQKTSLVMVK